MLAHGALPRPSATLRPLTPVSANAHSEEEELCVSTAISLFMHRVTTTDQDGQYQELHRRSGERVETLDTLCCNASSYGPLDPTNAAVLLCDTSVAIIYAVESLAAQHHFFDKPWLCVHLWKKVHG